MMELWLWTTSVRAPNRILPAATASVLPSAIIHQQENEIILRKLAEKISGEVFGTGLGAVVGDLYTMMIR